ncbi:MAG: glycosidase [Armatimonadetes bacterium]|nr:glycosidase [Armatimonadota bacterium]
MVKRYHGNPVLTASDWHYPVHAVFNPGATRLEDGSTLLLCRCENHGGISHFCRAISKDGYTNWKVDTEPCLLPSPDSYPEELWGIEDPRITYVEEFGQYAIAYTAFGEGGPGVSLAFTKDFLAYKRRGLCMQPEDKDAALFPRRFKEGFALIHRPVTSEHADMWLSYSPDLKNWGRPSRILKARKGAWWDANKIGLSPPPVETAEGWLVFYHGVRRHASGSLYRLGVALLDLEDPSRLVRRGQHWIMGPIEPYERVGDVPNVVFPTGAVLAEDKDTIVMYYGAADSSICIATTTVKQVLEFLNSKENDCSLETGSDP